jgi:hypothetical protein
MLCAAYQKLKKELETERERWLTFVATSERKSQELALEALASMNNLRHQMFRHLQLCSECNHPATTIAPKVRSATARGSN